MPPLAVACGCRARVPLRAPRLLRAPVPAMGAFVAPWIGSAFCRCAPLQSKALRGGAPDGRRKLEGYFDGTVPLTDLVGPLQPSVLEYLMWVCVLRSPDNRDSRAAPCACVSAPCACVSAPCTAVRCAAFPYASWAAERAVASVRRPTAGHALPPACDVAFRRSPLRTARLPPQSCAASRAARRAPADYSHIPDALTCP
jgi:hypothetical protein